ncbi:hypothetical protein [Methylosarcina fibrata]|uniref:hypothetical protein n=1 Tax=Methylosarcina fibrata TaxID=105972 RepID=UPI00036B3BAE|nr:hypothetical protein [Methylosarcina fibrata]
MIKHSIFILSIWLCPVPAMPVQAVDKAAESRLDDVARRGAKVMPFSLEETIHVFTKTKTGGRQQVIAKNKTDAGQIRLIQKHLAKIAKAFSRGDFSDPAKIHGEDMPGLAKLKAARPGELRMAYRDLPDGGEIEYASQVPGLIAALHAWFDAQLSDHARHAVTGHSSHSMHHPP